jgi:hydrogenase nickel incorporation protein HypA/HybF
VHELSIAQSVVESVRSELAARPGHARLVAVGLRVGELSGVQSDALRFSFEIIVKDTELEHARLDIEEVPVTSRCRACEREFRVANFDPTCPGCGSLDTVPAGGDELQLSYLELE